MVNVCDIHVMKPLLAEHGFHFSKAKGQNFLIASWVPESIARESGITSDVGVLEIGPGIGVLTVELAKLAKKVVAVEVDTRLENLLAENLAPYPNAEVVWGDVMELDVGALLKEKFSDCKRIVVCANLPYYITSPIIMMLLESHLPIESITVMVQKEAADRMCAKVGSRASGAVTVAVWYYSEPEILFKVSAGSFLPPPKVDSAVMRLDVRSEPLYDVGDESVFRALVKAGFSQRRKTLVNSVSSDRRFGKEKVLDALEAMGIEPNARIEQLNMEQLAELSRRLG